MDIKEVSALTGIKAHTLRYYENIGLINNITRDSNGRREYSENDIKWIEFLKRLKETGMKLSKMKKYVELKNIGSTTIKERKVLLQVHAENIENEIKKLSGTLEYIYNKIDIYKKMEEKKDEKKWETIKGL